MSADTQIKEILDRYGENFAESTWVVPGGKARAIKHPAIERMAAKAGIRFDLPQIIDASPENVVIIVSGSMPGAEPVWSFGEANPKNNKNAYFYAMAEKRAKGRVALKLLNLHGLLYSEEEADDFRQPPPGKAVPTIPAKPAVSPASLFIAALNHSANEDDLSSWYEKNSEAIAALDDGYQAEVREAYRVKLRTLRQQQRAA